MKHSAGWLIALRCTRPRHRSSLLLYERGRSELRALEALLHQRVRCLIAPLPVQRDPLLPWAWFPSRTSPVPRWWTLRRAGRSRCLYPGADGEPSTPCAGGVCPRRKAAAHRSGCGPLGVVDVQRAGPTGWTSQLSVGQWLRVRSRFAMSLLSPRPKKHRACLPTRQGKWMQSKCGNSACGFRVRQRRAARQRVELKSSPASVRL